jgi:tRNA (guanine10-N2)-dimethyltransferase
MEYPCLSLMELSGLLGKNVIIEALTGVFITNNVDIEKLKKSIAMSSCLKEAGLVLRVKGQEDWKEKINELQACRYIRITIRRVGGIGRQINKQQIISYFKKSCPGKIVLEAKKPEIKEDTCNLSIIITDGVIIYGIPIYYQGKSKLLSINPHDLPYYSPGALNPWFSRLLTNIAGLEKGVLLDPFCGTASIPTWASSNYHTIVCGDINPVHCKGGLANYSWLHGFDSKINIVRWDYNYLPMREASIDAIVTDLPYGRSVRSRGTSEEELAERFFKTFCYYLKNNGVTVVSISEDLYKFYKQSLCYLDSKCLMFIHNKLSRVILRFVKKTQQVDPSSLIRQG